MNTITRTTDYHTSNTFDIQNRCHSRKDDSLYNSKKYTAAGSVEYHTKAGTHKSNFIHFDDLPSFSDTSTGITTNPESIEEQNTSLGKCIIVLKENIKTPRRALRQTLAKKEEILETAKREIFDLQQEINTLRKSLLTPEYESLESMHNNIQSLTRQNNDLQEIIVTKNANYKTAQEKIGAFESQLQLLKDENYRLSQEAGALKAEHEQLKTKNDRLNLELENIKNQKVETRVGEPSGIVSDLPKCQNKPYVGYTETKPKQNNWSRGKEIRNRPRFDWENCNAFKQECRHLQNEIRQLKRELEKQKHSHEKVKQKLSLVDFEYNNERIKSRKESSMLETKCNRLQIELPKQVKYNNKHFTENKIKKETTESVSRRLQEKGSQNITHVEKHLGSKICCSCKDKAVETEKENMYFKQEKYEKEVLIQQLKKTQEDATSWKETKAGNKDPDVEKEVEFEKEIIR